MKLKHLLPKCSAATTAVEYAIVVAVIALVIIPAMSDIGLRLDSNLRGIRYALAVTFFPGP